MSTIRITGQDIYSEAVMAPLVQDACGQDLMLGELKVYARRITKYFRGQAILWPEPSFLLRGLKMAP